jgi:hypothetical protein
MQSLTHGASHHEAPFSFWEYSRAVLGRDTVFRIAIDCFGTEHWADSRVWPDHRRMAIIDLSDQAR